jgi:hypothetical protein
VWLLSQSGRPPGVRRRGSEQMEELERRLKEREAAIQTVRAERDRFAGELARHTLAPASPSAPAPEDSDAIRRLKRKVEEQQAELRHKQHERHDLQKRLRALSAGDGEARGRARAEPLPVEEEVGEPVPEEAGAAIHPVHFTDVFYGTAADVDDGRVLLRAQELAVRFAALDPATWKQAKKMQDLKDVFTLRVGIHHRLFLTRKEGEVSARELVTRESFDRTLKRYRRYDF